jgi:hypothetical protein
MGSGARLIGRRTGLITASICLQVLVTDFWLDPNVGFGQTRKGSHEHNESGVPQKAEVVATLSHFRVGPGEDVNC